MTRAFLGLGANLGDAREAMRTAIATLAAADGVELVDVSGLWRTAPVGGPDQPEYRNAVVGIDTSLTPADLLDLAGTLERAADRVREVRWGPRTLDVDILDVEGYRSDDPHLTIPHPRAHVRAFVLAPWAQLDPEWLLVPVEGSAGSEASDGPGGRTVGAWWAQIQAVGDPEQRVDLEQGGAWWR